MRIFKITYLGFSIFSIFIGCKEINNNSSEVLYAYVEQYINDEKLDERLYAPPPPPELKKNKRDKGGRKNDSIVGKLKTLNVYINDMVRYDSIVDLSKQEKKGFDFFTEINLPKQDFKLKRKKFSKKDKLLISFISTEKFLNKQVELSSTCSFGGFVSFKNLYYSKSGDKAIFEVNYFKRKLNSSSSIVYAEKQSDNSWKFYMDMISIS